MKFEDTIRPIDVGVSKAILLGISIIIIAVGASIFTLTYLMASNDMSSTFYGMVVIWIGSLVFFYAVIIEEHTLKELFIRQAYFYTGLLTMILGMFFVSAAGLSEAVRAPAVEFGLLLLILGGALVVFSAQRTHDYSRRSSALTIFGGVLLAGGGLMTNNLNVAYAGVFMVILGGMWLGLRSRSAD